MCGFMRFSQVFTDVFQCQLVYICSSLFIEIRDMELRVFIPRGHRNHFKKGCLSHTISVFMDETDRKSFQTTDIMQLNHRFMDL